MSPWSDIGSMASVQRPVSFQGPDEMGIGNVSLPRVAGFPTCLFTRTEIVDSYPKWSISCVDLKSEILMCENCSNEVNQIVDVVSFSIIYHCTVDVSLKWDKTSFQSSARRPSIAPRRSRISSSLGPTGTELGWIYKDKPSIGVHYVYNFAKEKYSQNNQVCGDIFSIDSFSALYGLIEIAT